MADFRELTISEEGGADLLKRFYNECFVREFQDPDERESLDNIETYLRLKEHGWYGPNNYHVIVASDGDEMVAGSISDYLAEPNAGVIEFLFVNSDRCGAGLGGRLREFTEQTLAGDAERIGNTIAWIVGEVEDPFRTPIVTEEMDTFTRAFIWHRWGYRMLEFPYVQPALSAEQLPVHTLLLTAKTCIPDYGRSVPAHAVCTLVHEYMKWAMRIPAPETDPSFVATSEYLTPPDRPIGLTTLAAYLGREDPALRTHEVVGNGDPELEAAIDVYTAVFTDPATAVPVTEFREAFGPGGLARSPGCHFHLWSIYHSDDKTCEGMASFFTMPSAGFGGYLALLEPLRGSGKLHQIIARIEERMLRDGSEARGWYVECAGTLERDIALRPRSGFTELDVPYAQPGLPGSAAFEADHPLHLLYKTFGRVYSPPSIPVAEFLTSIGEVYEFVYGVTDLRSCDAFTRLERALSGRSVVPLKRQS